MLRHLFAGCAAPARYAAASAASAASAACAACAACATCAAWAAVAFCIGTAHAAPTVVLQAGLGDGQQAWRPILPALQQHGAVFAYDRAGYGDAASVEGTRDPCTIARELHALLQQQKIAAPYLLVGHSIGGLYQYVYARLYPAEVAGMVLLDPTHPEHWASMQREVPTLAAVVRSMNALSLSSANRREFRDQTVCLDQLDQRQPLAMPVRLLVSGISETGATPAFRTMLERLRKDWLRLSGASQLQVVAESGHYLQKDAPEVVLQAIEAVRTSVTASTSAAPSPGVSPAISTATSERIDPTTDISPSTKP